MKTTLTKRIGLVLLLPFLGSVAGVLVLNSLLNETRLDFRSLGIASQQSMLIADLPDWIREAARDQKGDRSELRSRIEGFHQALAVLQDKGEGREGSQPVLECKPCHEPRAGKMTPAPAAVQPDLALVASLWNQIEPDLLFVAEAPIHEPRFIEAYRRVEERLPELQNLSKRVVMAIAAEHHRQFDKLLWTLVLIAAASGVMLLVGLFLTRRYVTRDTAERKQAEEALREGETRYRTLFEQSPDGVLIIDAQTTLPILFNDVAFRQLGYSREEFARLRVSDYEALEGPEVIKTRIEKLLREGRDDFETKHRAKTGDLRNVLVTVQRIELSGRPVLHCIFRDLTERKQAEADRKGLEDQLRSSQKMEAIGRLTGGIAHDFNNLLGIINGYSELSLSGLKDDDPLRSNLKEIQEAGERAAALTRQLLAFSRRQVLQPRVLNLNDVIGRAERMLRRLIGEDINMATFSEPGLGQVKADPGQMEQVIMNLAVNARDAMPQGGKLTIETRNVLLNRENTDWAPDVEEGRYVVMSVSDTGTGMDAKTLEHIFEPFFTTKEKGKGTGLGLSTVHGIVKQSGGHVSVYSEPGHGTSVKVYLPRVDDTVESLVSPNIPTGSLSGSETVLVVEDEERLRKLVCRILDEKGYAVLEASSGDEALRLSKSHKGPIHLLATDVVMPGLSGRETAEELKSLRPEIKVLYMSGYTDDAIVRHGILEEGVVFLQKPFSPEVLARKVREVLS